MDQRRHSLQISIAFHCKIIIEFCEIFSWCTMHFHFTRIRNTRVYSSVEDSQPGFPVCYLTGSTFPASDSFSLQDAWGKYPGYFLMLEKKPGDLSKFATAIEQAPLPAPKHLSFAWVSYDDVSIRDIPYLLTTKMDDEGRVVIAADTTFDFLNYRIPFFTGTLIYAPWDAPDNDANPAFTIAYPKLEHASSPPAGMGLAVSLDGEGRFCFEGEALLHDFSDSADVGWNAAMYYSFGRDPKDKGTLCAQRYPLFDQSAAEDATQYLVDLRWDPLLPLDENRTYLKFTGQSFILKPNKAGEFPPYFFEPGSIKLVSYYRTVYGATISLYPVADSAKLVIERIPGENKYALTPVGDFEIGVEDAPTADIADLMCGLEGTEYISFHPRTDRQPGDRLRFIARQPAHASNYPFRDASPVGPPVDVQAKLLDATYTTSWATVVPAPETAGQIPYVAQPKGASLYGLDEDINQHFPSLYGSKDPSVVLTGDEFFPLVPTAGTTIPSVKLGAKSVPFTAEQTEDFERQVIGPTRRTAIGKSRQTIHSKKACLQGQSVEGVASYNATTPSGLIATIAGNTWTKVLLGQNLHGADGGIRQMSFCQPGDALLQALQTNQLFLVVANRDNLGHLAATVNADCEGTPTFLNSMNIEDWILTADVGQTATDDPQSNKYGDYYNVMIIKGRKGKLYDPKDSLKDDPTGVTNSLVANPAMWTQRDTFASPATAGHPTPDAGQQVILSQWLKTYFRDAHEQPDTVSFQKFNTIAQDENWTGILILRMKIASLPDNLAGVAAGVTSPNQFNAHHFAIEISQVKNETGQQPDLKETSSMFGLIYYVDPAFTPPAKGKIAVPVPPTAGALYDFRLLSLKVLFENSAVKDFQSYAQITLNSFFGMSVTKMGDGGNPYNTIVLAGSYQTNNGKPIYSLGSTSHNTFYFGSDIIQKIQIDLGQMSTRNSGTKTAPPTVISWFGLSGFIDFEVVSQGEEGTDKILFDVFSFGNEPHQDELRKGLRFSNLGLMMSYPKDEPERRELNFDSSEIRFDLATSTPRSGSLFLDFALELQGMTGGTSETTPAKGGYLQVITDARLTGVDGGPWFGLRYRLNMGSPGELAGKVSLTSYLLTAWAPDSNAGGPYKALVGIELPGTGGGAKLISLQTVLKLSIGQLRLTRVPTAGGDKRAFLLMFTDIALRILGILKVPPSGSTLFYLFGNPEDAGKPSGLGWYARYCKDNFCENQDSLVALDEKR
jgi:hypothetical protein